MSRVPVPRKFEEEEASRLLPQVNEALALAYCSDKELDKKELEKLWRIKRKCVAVLSHHNRGEDD